MPRLSDVAAGGSASRRQRFTYKRCKFQHTLNESSLMPKSSSNYARAGLHPHWIDASIFSSVGCLQIFGTICSETQQNFLSRDLEEWGLMENSQHRHPMHGNRRTFRSTAAKQEGEYLENMTSTGCLGFKASHPAGTPPHAVPEWKTASIGIRCMATEELSEAQRQNKRAPVPIHIHVYDCIRTYLFC